MSFQDENLREITVIAPNLKRRLSGVTSTIVQLIPMMRKNGLKIACLGPGLPSDLPHLRWRQLVGLWRLPVDGSPRIWHARRNNEMLAGIILRDLLRMPVKLLFTSAAQRHHSAYTRKLIARMDGVIATSGRSAAFLKVPHDIVRHGVDLEKFHPPADGEDDALETPPGEHFIGCFGRVRESKGTDIFVKAMIALLPRYPGWTAVISGRVKSEHAGFTDELKKEIEAADLSTRIHFIGEVDDIKPWYRKLSLYVAPSRNEGFGLTPLEAMASATPVVASSAGAYPEIIVNGDTGQVVATGDLDAMTNAIEPYLADPQLCHTHGLNGRKHVEENFGLENEAGSLMAIYEKMRKNP